MIDQSRDSEAARWPLASMLCIGTFGSANSPAARLYHRRCWAAFAILIVGTLLSSVAGASYGAPGTEWVFAALLGGTFTYIAWALWRYVSALDELGRRVQTEAMAITYLIGMALFMALAGVQTATKWNISPLFFITLELIRSAVLVVVSRQYR
jgi:biotin transporter BioY